MVPSHVQHAVPLLARVCQRADVELVVVAIVAAVALDVRDAVAVDLLARGLGQAAVEEGDVVPCGRQGSRGRSSVSLRDSGQQGPRLRWQSGPDQLQARGRALAGWQLLLPQLSVLLTICQRGVDQRPADELSAAEHQELHSEGWWASRNGSGFKSARGSVNQSIKRRHRLLQDHLKKKQSPMAMRCMLAVQLLHAPPCEVVAMPPPGGCARGGGQWAGTHGPPRSVPARRVEEDNGTQ